MAPRHGQVNQSTYKPVDMRDAEGGGDDHGPPLARADAWLVL